MLFRSARTTAEEFLKMAKEKTDAASCGSCTQTKTTVKIAKILFTTASHEVKSRSIDKLKDAMNLQ